MLVVAGSVYTLTMPFERLRLGASELLRQTGVETEAANPGDGTGEVSHAIGALLDRLTAVKQQLKSHDSQFDETLRVITTVFTTTANDWRTTPKAMPVTSPWPERSSQLAVAYAKFHEATAVLGQRAAVFQSLVHNLPQPVLIFDTNNVLQLMNLSAEKIYTQFADRAQRHTLADFFMTPVVKTYHHDAATPMTPDELVTWVAKSNGGDREAVAAVPGGRGLRVNVTIATKLARQSQKYVTLILRDVSATQKAESEARLNQRRVLGQRLCSLMDNQSKPALNVNRTQAELLAQAAKQAGERDRFVPKVQRLLEELGRQDVIVDQLGWLGRLTQSFDADQDHDELRNKDVVKAAVDRLAPSLSDRNNAAEIHGEAGWVMADADWMGALFVGALMHANPSTDQNKVAVTLSRRSVAHTHSEMVDVRIRYTGAPPTDDLLQDIREPFRRPDSLVFDPVTPVGFPLGLAVAHRIVTIKSGELEFESDGKSQTIRITLPTRDLVKPVASQPTPAVNKVEAAPQEAEMSDALGSWGMGGGAAVATAAVTAIEQPKVAVDTMQFDQEPTLVDDSVGAWFGGQ